jgi:hypothetical protein
MSEILKSDDEPKVEKKKRVMSEKQLENLKKGRERALIKAREKKAEKAKQKEIDDNILKQAKEKNKIEPLTKEDEPIIKEKEPIEEVDDNDSDDELPPKPEPLLKRRAKKVQPVQTAKEKLEAMRAKKREELEELKLEKEIEQQEEELNKLRNKPQKPTTTSLSSAIPINEPIPTYPTITYGQRTRRGRYF